MYNILTLNKIAACGTDRLGDNYKVADDVQAPDAIMVRSAAMSEKDMATHFSVLARRIPEMADPGGLLFLGSHSPWDRTESDTTEAT